MGKAAVRRSERGIAVAHMSAKQQWSHPMGTKTQWMCDKRHDVKSVWVCAPQI